MDAIDVFGIIFYLINIVILTPFILYSLSQFNKHQNEDMMKYRCSTLVYAIHFIVLFCLVFERLYVCLVCIWNVIDMPMWTVHAFLSITWCAVMNLFVIKVYSVYYKQQLNISISNISWKKSINSNESDWYIDNKNKYGNTIYLIKILLIPYCLSVIIQSLIPYFTGKGATFFFLHYICIITPVIIAFIIYQKAQALDDQHKIRNEILYQCIGFCFVFNLCAVSSIYFNFIQYLPRVEWLLHIPLTFIVATCLTIINTIYPVYKCKQVSFGNDISNQLAIPSDRSTMELYNDDINEMLQIISEYKTFQQFMQYLIREFSTENLLFLTELVQIKHNFQIKNNNIIRVPKQSIIGNPFDVIMSHINLIERRKKGIDVIDVMDVIEEKRPALDLCDVDSNKNDNSRYITIDFHEINNNDDEFNNNIHNNGDKYIWTYLFDDSCRYCLVKLLLPLNLPHSSILINGTNNLFDEMYLLYVKYIKSESHHEINIQYSLRKALTDFFEDSDEFNKYKNKNQDYKIFNILDEAALEILKLLQSPFLRFKQTPSYSPNIKQTELNNETNTLPIFRNAASYNALRKQYNKL